MKSILMVLAAAFIALTSVSPVWAADPATPTVPTAGAPTDAAPAPIEKVPMFAQPEGAKRFYV